MKADSWMGWSMISKVSTIPNKAKRIPKGDSRKDSEMERVQCTMTMIESKMKECLRKTIRLASESSTTWMDQNNMKESGSITTFKERGLLHSKMAQAIKVHLFKVI
jgi:hypothetical protein